MALLLRLGAVHDERRADDAQAEGVDWAWRIGQRHLLGDDCLLHRPGILTAVLAGPAHADEARLVERALPGFTIGERLERRRRVFGKPAPHAAAESFVF